MAAAPDAASWPAAPVLRVLFFKGCSILNRGKIATVFRILGWANRNGTIPMNYRGIEYSGAMTTTPGIWKWQFRIGDELKTGKTETKISLLAIRRVQLRIDRALKLAAREPTS
jgi:hypothetical protein